jgi:hypothetical protein
MVAFLIGAVVELWYVFAPLAVVVGSAWLLFRRRKKRAEEERLRHRRGPRDPWLDEVVVSLAEFGFSEYGRNTGSQVAGVPIEGDVRLDAPRFSVVVTLCATPELARQAELALRAKPEVRSAMEAGKLLVRSEGRILYTANGRGGVVDESRLDEVAQIVGGISIGPPRPEVPTPKVGPGSSPARTVAPKPLARPQAQPVSVASSQGLRQTEDVLAQIQRLAALRDSGILTELEFQEKKAELLRRL